MRARNLAFGQMGPASNAKTWDIDGASIAADVRPTKTMRPSAVEAA